MTGCFIRCLVIICPLFALQSVVTENCAFAARNNDIQPVAVTIHRKNLRRQRETMIPAGIKYKFGITYPPGIVLKTTTSWPPTIMAQEFTLPSRPMTRDLFPWRPTASYKSPPTLFFPLGSSPVTVTVYPIPHLFIEHYTQYVPCEIFLRLCLRAYDTGYVCGRALYDTFFTFENYCSMEVENCKMKSAGWQLAYFGNCDIERIPDNLEDFNIEGDNFLEAAVINEPPFNPLTGRQEGF